MRFSIWPSSRETADTFVELARHGERTGWDGFWVADHFMPHDGDLDQPTLECSALISALSLSVPRLRFGALVAGNTYRHPAVFAKTMVTADQLSGGRVVLGLGAGWQENEHLAYGLEFPALKGRIERFEEACALIKQLIANERTDFKGKYYTLVDAPFAPKPAGPLPLLIGAAGEKVTMRIAARYADEWNCWGDPELFAHKTRVLDRHCEELGRDPGEIKRSTQVVVLLRDSPAELRQLEESDEWPRRISGNTDQIIEQLCAYAQAGLDEFILPVAGFGEGEERKDRLEAFIQAARSVPELSPQSAN